MVYTLSRSADPILANINNYISKTPTTNVLANSTAVQPYQSAFTTINIPSIFTNNTGRSNMGFSCGCLPAPNTHFLPNMPRFGNGTLFTISGSAFNVPYSGNTVMGGSIGGCCNGGSIFSSGYAMPLMSSCGGGMLGGVLGGIGNILGGFGFPIYGSGSTAGGGCANSASYKGAAYASPFGSTVLSNNPFGKSKTINLGGIGSYAKGDGGKAWNILGLVSHSKSGGHSSTDLSGLIHAFTGGLF